VSRGGSIINRNEREVQNARMDAALELGIAKCLGDAERLNAFPHVTRDGDWLISEHGRWTAGFFVGMLWIAGLVRDDTRVFETAETWAKRLVNRSLDRSTHDLGFLFEPSTVRGYNILGRDELRDTAVQAARSLATRFHPRGHFIPAWSPQEDTSYLALAIVDTIMNLPIILWAAREMDDTDLLMVGRRCAETIRAQHVRADGATYHTVDHDGETGAVTERGTHQGAHRESCWTRGQAWALYGFTKMARMMESEDMLATARKIADYFLDRLGDQVLPPWDFDRDADGEPRDSAAGAIAASGLLELGRASGDTAYSDAARRIVLGLIETCVDFEQPERPGFLLHGTVDYPRRSGVDESIMYGDHYFMEALVKLRHPQHWDVLGCS
jgi:unsaturated chondroitin disaccharide hydrolase